MMTDDELLRYSRHILLPDIDVAGQQAFKAAHVCIVGLGGLGSPVAMYLAASGIGQLTLVDFDTVDVSNLQRQIVHAEVDVQHNKAQSAKASVQALNPLVSVTTVEEKVEPLDWDEYVEAATVVVDCTDNFATRFALNAACFRQKKPLVSGAAIRMEGQLSVFDHRYSESPCYQCLYSTDVNDDLRCSEAGVAAPLVGVIGSLQALETLKLIANIGQSLMGRLVLFDAKNHQWREMKLPKDPHCDLCSSS